MGRAISKNSVALVIALSLFWAIGSLATLARGEGTGKIVVQGAGASFPDTYYQDLVFAYQFVAPNVKTSYLATGSTGGKCRIKDFVKTCTDNFGTEAVDFAGSDSLLKRDEYIEYPDLQMLPTVAGAVVPVYNVPVINVGGNETLVVDREVLAGIFMGVITKWSDPVLLALQSESVKSKLNSSTQDIQLIVRADGSGSTEVFTKSIDRFSNFEFAKKVGKPSDKATVWDGLQGKVRVVKKSYASGVAAGVILTPWSVGYSSIGEAVALDLAVARFKQNKRQLVPVKADLDSVAFALLEKGLQYGNNGDDPSWMTADIMDAAGDGAWPIATYTYLILRNGLSGDRFRDGATCENVVATAEFWNWFYTSELAAELAKRHSFVTLPELVKTPVVDKLRGMKCGGELSLKKILASSSEKLTIQGQADDVVAMVMSLYTVVFQAIDPIAKITTLDMPTDLIDTSERLPLNVGFRVVIGNDVYKEEWVKQDMNKVYNSGKLLGAPWDSLHPENGEDTSVVLPWFAFALHFQVSIPGQSADNELVLTPITLKGILEGTISTWNDAALLVENPWLSTLNATVPIVVVAHRRKDTIYKHIATELSNGFPTWEIAGKSNTYESLAALTTGVNGAFSYGPHLGPQPKSARFAQLKWGSGATPVPPSFDSVMACAKDVNAFDRELRFFTPNPDLDGCYPVTMVVNSIFPHSYANLTGVCWVDEEIGKQGSGVPAVKFWDWIYSADGELNAEQAIVSLNGVPLTLEVNNSDQVAAVGHIVDTIQCDHPPNEAVFDATLIIIIASCVGGTLLIVGGFASHVIHTRNQMLANPLKGFNVQKHINEVLQDVEAITDGTVATYIPELGKVPPHLFAIAVVTCDGKVYKGGDWEYQYSIQSMSKPIAYAHAITERGFEFMKTKVNVEPAGGAFDTMDMDPQGRPFNPYINSGAICVAMQLEGDMHQRFRDFARFISSFCGRQVDYDRKIYQSESSTAARNRAIGEKLLENGICDSEFDKQHGLEAYFMFCSIMINTVDLAQLAATCAHGGRNAVTKVQACEKEIIEEMMSVMMTCGMYNGAGNWMVDVGIPAKSGVSGGIFGVVPGVCGVAVFSPKLNPTYNSVRGIQAFNELSRRLRLHVLKKKKPPTWMEAITGRRKDRGADAAVSTISSSVFKSAAEKEQKAAKIAALNEQVSAKGDIPAGKIAWAESEVKPLI